MYQYHMSRDMLPRWVRDKFDVVESITIGGCNCRIATRGPFAKLRRRAGAHAGTIGIHSIGTPATRGRVKICVRSSFDWDSDYPTPLFLHEVAHGLTADNWSRNGRHIGHGKAWRRTFQSLLDTWHKGKYAVHNSTYMDRALHDARKLSKIALTTVRRKKTVRRLFKLSRVKPGEYRYGDHSRIWQAASGWWRTTPYAIGEFVSLEAAIQYVDLYLERTNLYIARAGS